MKMQIARRWDARLGTIEVNGKQRDECRHVPPDGTIGARRGSNCTDWAARRRERARKRSGDFDARVQATRDEFQRLAASADDEGFITALRRWLRNTP